MKISKTQIDKSGYILSGKKTVDEIQFIEYESIFDEYRKEHLPVLTRITSEIQEILSFYDASYYIAQRLKRKPQIIRKLKRLPVRLTQLQDIGGLRIIVKKNSDVDKLYDFIKSNIRYEIVDFVDYRERGRDDTGYRALHIIIGIEGYKIELQIRSLYQHYWAEGIERTSVIYGYFLKGYEGDLKVIKYFKKLSDIFYEIESGHTPTAQQKIELDSLRSAAETIIENSDKKNVLYGHVNKNAIKSLIDKESKKRGVINNWILVFDWNSGCFVSWDAVEKNPDIAIQKYVKYEKDFPAEQGFEVVLIGSSDVSTIKETHSHYFGIDTYENILESIDVSILNVKKRMSIDTGARKILLCLTTRRYWNKNIAINTLKNHYCKSVVGFDESLALLKRKGFIIMPSDRGPVMLNIAKKSEIESCL